MHHSIGFFILKHNHIKKNCENCVHYEPRNELRGICQRVIQIKNIEEMREDEDSDPNQIYSFGVGVCFYDFKCKMHRIVPKKECHHF